MIISFSATIEGIVSKAKTVTRRNWTDSHAAKLCKAWDNGKLEHKAYTKTPVAGGEFLATIKLTCRPYKETLIDMPESDVALEAVPGVSAKEQFLNMPLFADIKEVWVVRFEVVEIAEKFVTVNAEKPATVNAQNPDDANLLYIAVRENQDIESIKSTKPKRLTPELSEHLNKYDWYWETDKELGEYVFGNNFFLHLSHCVEIYRDWEIFINSKGEDWMCDRYVAISNLQHEEIYWADLSQDYLSNVAEIIEKTKSTIPKFDIEDENLILYARSKINTLIAESQKGQLELAIA